METPKTLTTDECKKLLTQLQLPCETDKQRSKGIRNHTITLLMLDAGLRVGEVVKLQSRHLYFNCQPVTSIIISAEIAKNKTERIIPVSQRLSNALKNHAQCNGAFDNLFYDKFVFYHGDPQLPLTTRQVERIIRAAAMKALGRPVHPHILRHTFASRLMRKVNIRVVQELLGHKSLTSTQIYTHPNQEDLKNAIDNMDDRDDVYKENGRSQNLPCNVSNRPDTSGTDRDMG